MVKAALGLHRTHPLCSLLGKSLVLTGSKVVLFYLLRFDCLINIIRR
jgi:hypothetical protein